MKILMVCLGNICRSPMAEGILKQKAKDAVFPWLIDSAGTNGFHVGEAPHYLSQKVSRKHGIDISKQKARKFIKEDFDKFDKIYALADDVMEEIKTISKEKFDSEKVILLLDELYPGKHLNVPDPWYGPEQGFYEVFELIEKACEKIIENYTLAISS